MAYWSDHFSTGLTASVQDKGVTPGAGIGFGRTYYKRMAVRVGFDATLGAIGQRIHMGSLKSNDRMTECFVTSDGGATVLIAHLGFYTGNADHDGAVIDSDRIATALVLDAAIARVDQFLQSTNLVNLDRGKQIWQLAGLAADPGGLIDLDFTITSAPTGADTNVLVEVFAAGPA